MRQLRHPPRLLDDSSGPARVRATPEHQWNAHEARQGRAGQWSKQWWIRQTDNILAGMRQVPSRCSAGAMAATMSGARANPWGGLRPEG
jgi:hypothetical protein